MTLARDTASMGDVLRLLRWRAACFRLKTPEALSRSLSCERYETPARHMWQYAPLCRFRTLRQDARVAAARRALARGDA